MPISIKRVYEPYSRADGRRYLCDRFWPRGISKEKLHAEWVKDLAPSKDLIEWFHRAPESRWEEFVKRYRREIASRDSPHLDDVKKLAKISLNTHITLVYSVHNVKYNNAKALRRILNGVAARL